MVELTITKETITIIPYITLQGEKIQNIIILMMATYKVTLELTEEQKSAIFEFIRLNNWTVKVTEERITDNVHVARKLPDVTAGNLQIC